LYERTEGWAAGLRLAVICLSGHPEPDRFVDEFSGTDRAIGEYLMAEMLERQPIQVQSMLLRTSVADRLNGELADLLAGRPGSEQMLLALEDAERHLSDGAALAEAIGRPYTEVACRAYQAFPSVSVEPARERGRYALALADRYGFGDRPVPAPALGAVASIEVWTGEFEEGERWLHRGWEVIRPDIDPAAATLLHTVTGVLHAGRGEHQAALEALTAAVQAQSLLTGAHILGPVVAHRSAFTKLPDRDRPLGRPGRHVDADRRKARPPLRLGAGCRPRRPRPLVRRGQPLPFRRPWRRRRAGEPAALASKRLGGGRPLG